MQTHDRSIADEATKTALPARLSAPQRRPACRRKKPMSHHHQKVSPAQKASVQHAAVIGQSLVASAVTSEESGVTDAAATRTSASPSVGVSKTSAPLAAAPQPKPLRLPLSQRYLANKLPP